MSSSRDQTTLIGLAVAFRIVTASETKSDVPRRPNPPPSSVLFTLTLFSGSPVISAATFLAMLGTCDPTQTSHSLPVIRAVQFIGSIGACARYGMPYTPDRFDGALFSFDLSCEVERCAINPPPRATLVR